MITTNNIKLYETAAAFNNHGKNLKNIILYQI